MCMHTQKRSRKSHLCMSYPLQVCAHGQRTLESGGRVSRAGVAEAERSRWAVDSRSESAGQNGEGDSFNFTKQKTLNQQKKQ